MIIIKDLIPLSYQNEIEATLSSSFFPWFYYDYTASPDNYGGYVDSKSKDCGQFVHQIIKDGKVNSSCYDLIQPMVVLLEDRLNTKLSDRILRIKANLMLKQETYPSDCYNTPHVDDRKYSKLDTLVYYVNNSDGDTVLFNERVKEVVQGNDLTIAERKSPTKGDSIFFDSTYLHASSPPRFSDTRIVLNFVFKP